MIMTQSKAQKGNQIKFRDGKRLRSGKIVKVTPCCYHVMSGSHLVSVSKRDLVVIQDDDGDCE